MEKDLKISCPDCGVILIVDRITGEIIEVRRPLVKNSSGDRFADSMKKLEIEKAHRQNLFDNIAEEQARKKAVAEQLFNASLKDVKENPDDIRPENIFDRD